MKNLEMPERRSLTDVIHDQLERMILSGRLKPGEPVNEKSLSDNNGLSRGPIREACRRLEEAGLVEIIVNRGTFVRKISYRTATELCNLRELLAIYAIRRVVDRIQPEQVQAIITVMEKIEAAINTGDLHEFSDLNSDFHTMLIEAGGNQRLTMMYSAINKELTLFRWRALSQRTELSETLTAHRAIVSALIERNTDALVEAVEAHLRTATHRLLDMGIIDE